MNYINNLGEFDSLADVWKEYPHGGKEGDYVVINGVNVEWNKYTTNWGADTEMPDVNNEVNGDFLVKRDLRVGGEIINKDLKWIKEATVLNKGYFKTVDDLKRSYPAATAGSKAYVGSDYPYAIYLWDGKNAAWVDSGVTGGEEKIILNDYYTKAESDEKFTELESDTNTKLTELKSGIGGIDIKGNSTYKNAGFNADLSIYYNSSYCSAIIDIEQYSALELYARCSEIYPSYITDENRNIIGRIVIASSVKTECYKNVDLSEYPNAKYLYFQNYKGTIPDNEMYIYAKKAQSIIKEIEVLDNEIEVIKNSISENSEQIESAKKGLESANLNTDRVEERIGYDFFSFKAIDLEIGNIDEDGVIGSHSQRCRSKYFFPVRKGDTLLYTGNKWVGVKLFVYAEDKKTLLEKTDTSAAADYGAIKPYVFQNDGWLKIRCQRKDVADNLVDTSYFDRAATILRTITMEYEYDAIRNLTEETTSEYISYKQLTYGYVEDSTPKGSNIRVRTMTPVKVNKGDCIVSINRDIEFLLTVITEDGTLLADSSYSYFSRLVEQSGLAYINFRKKDNSEITDISAFDKCVKFVKSADVSNYFINEDFVWGYFDSGNGYAISTHNSRKSSTRMVKARKGDVVRCLDTNMEMHVYEFDQKNNILVDDAKSYYPLYLMDYNPSATGYAIGDYIVKSDNCYVSVRLQPNRELFPLDNTSARERLMRDTDFDKSVVVLHCQDANVINLSNQMKWITPLCNKRGREINYKSTYMQDGTIINGKLWISNDNYVGRYWIDVINIKTGEIEKTITHTLGHLSCMDYMESIDSIITKDGDRLLIYPNISNVNTSMLVEDAIKVELEDGKFDGSSVCFGESKDIVYAFIAFTGSTSDSSFIDKVQNKLYKLQLGFDANGNYNGTYEIVGEYSGDILYNVGSEYGRNGIMYIQGMAYDGYLYVGYGTSGHNFYVLDIDDNAGKFYVVGNYERKCYKGMERVYPEPEVVCLHNGKIYCGSRNTEKDVSWLIEFNL